MKMSQEEIYWFEKYTLEDNIEKKWGVYDELTYRAKLALKMVEITHAGQLRDGGAKYAVHPIAVANIIFKYRKNYVTLACIIKALLHDTIEDTALDRESIKQIFGEKISDGIWDLTKEEAFFDKEQTTAKYITKILNSGEENIMIKLADRYHNLLTIEDCFLGEVIRTVKETRRFYLPIARGHDQFFYRKYLELLKKYEKQYKL